MRYNFVRDTTDTFRVRKTIWISQDDWSSGTKCLWETQYIHDNRPLLQYKGCCKRKLCLPIDMKQKDLPSYEMIHLYWNRPEPVDKNRINQCHSVTATYYMNVFTDRLSQICCAFYLKNQNDRLVYRDICKIVLHKKLDPREGGTPPLRR